MKSDYESYSLDQLYELEASIDAKQHPQKFQDIQAEIDHRIDTAPLAEQPKHSCLIDIQDAGIHLVINQLVSGRFELRLSLAYSYLVSDHRASFKMTFTKLQLNKFIEDLKSGSPSWHGNSDFLGANKVYVKQCSPQVKSREIYLYRRWLIIGFNILSAQLSEAILQSILQLKLSEIVN